MDKRGNIFYQAVIGILVAVVIFLAWKTSSVQDDFLNKTEELKKSIIKSDKLLKESEGRYAKLVDYYKTEKELLSQIKKENKSLYNTIKEQDERLLSITNAIVTLDKKVVEGFGQEDPVDTNKINLSLKYPSDKDPFVFWDGWVNKNTAAYKGTFSFGKLPIQVVLTEESRGLWKSRVVGPEWLRVDSLQITSIPPEDYAPTEEKKIQWLVGGAYSYGLNDKSSAVGVNLGVSLFSSHNIVFGANTFQQVSLGYLYKIKSFKRTR
jgi:hypothetical protein